MGKLIKAELFRTKRINGFWVCVFFTFLYMIAVPYVTEMEVNSAEKFFTSAMSGMAVMGMLVSMMAAYITGRGYYHRTCMYEVMAGNSSLRIIVSKCLSISLPVTMVVYIPHLIGLSIACVMGGEGITDVLAKEPLFLLTLFRMSCFGTLITMCTRSMLGPVLVYVRVMLESIAMIIASATMGRDLMEGGADLVTMDSAGKILNTACLSQQGVLLSGSMESSMVLQIIIGFVIELLLWGVISYIIYEKKDY